MPRPLLDGFELQQVQRLTIDGDRVLVEHGVPALEGDFLQQLGRRAALVDLMGVLTGPESAPSLKTLREKFRKAQPVDFVADITAATRVGQVLIERMNIRELSGKPQRFEYSFRLREFLPPPAVPQEDPPIEPPPLLPPLDEGNLIVDVVVEGRPNFDFRLVTIRAEGTKSDDTALSNDLTNRAENRWTEEDFPAGSYTVQARVNDPETMTGSVAAEVNPGQTTQVTITLRPGEVIARAFVIHFWFDNSFVEPCMRHVLRQVAQHAQDNSDEKLVVVGHTDKAGPGDYNQSLSERRARAAFSFLMFGRNRQAAIDEWDEIRKRRTPGRLPNLNDSWGVREYQYMLQDLGLYNGNIDGDHGPLTDQAADAFRCLAGLPPASTVDDPTWRALIEHYLRRDNLQVPEDRFLENCSDTILEWLGVGEERPVLKWGCPPRGTAWRPYRRVEFLFVKEDHLPCEVPRPVTLDLPRQDPPPPEPRWCPGPEETPPPHGCPLRYAGHKNCQPKPSGDEKPWLVQFINSRTIAAQGTIRFEGFAPDTSIRLEFVLITAEGENADGEEPRGEPTPRKVQGKADENGIFEHEFSYPKKTVGVYTLEIRGSFVARLKDEPASAARGHVVCKRLDGNNRFDVIVTERPEVVVNPTITAERDFVVVKKPHTNPARLRLVLGLDFPFCHGDGVLTRSNDAIRFFTAANGGTEITFDGADNLFTGQQLSGGVEVFAEGVRASAAPNDVILTLTVTPSPTSPGPPAGPATTLAMTSVELTLDIAESRTDPSLEPPPLSPSDKVNVGRFILTQDATFSRERAILIVRPPNPSIPIELALTPSNALVELFAQENPATPTPPQTPLTTPRTIQSVAIPADGAKFFVEGKTASSAFRDTGFKLGIVGVEADGDRVAITVLGDPDQPGLFKVGEHEYTEADEGTFDLPRPGTTADDETVVDPPPAGTFTVRRRAVVRYPAVEDGSEKDVSTELASYPLAVILHGNHFRRFLTGPNAGSFVESYRGLEYLARHLASHGYIALTIDVDDINGFGNSIFHRGAAILEHIRIMAARNTSGPPAPGKVDFTGKIDLSQIALIGHSRGGEGVLAAQKINLAKGLGRNIRGIVSIAPTNFEDIVHDSTPLLILYGSADGDVRGFEDSVNPFLIYDRAAPPKAMIFAYGVNHNFFSTNVDWIDPLNIDNDDDRIIDPEDHKNIARGYATAFLERDFRRRTGFDTFFKNYQEPPSISHVDLHQQVQDPTRLVVDDFDEAAHDATTNSLSPQQAVSESGLAIPTGEASTLVEVSLRRAATPFFVHATFGGMIAWDAAGGIYETTLGGLNASSFRVLAFRITQRLGSARNTSGAVQDCSVRLTDTAGEDASLLVSSVTSIPFPFERHNHVVDHPPPTPLPAPPFLRFVDNPVLRDRPAFSKSALKTIRLSLQSFLAVTPALDVSSLQKLEFIFDQTSSGEIAVDNVEFSN